MTDYRRHLKSNMKGDFEDTKIDDSKKSKPRAIENEIFLSMVRDRDRLFYKEAKAKGDIATMEFLKNRHKK